MRKLLNGRKTYLSALLLVVLSGLKAQGYLDQGTYDVVLALLLGLGLASLRNSIPIKEKDSRKVQPDGKI